MEAAIGPRPPADARVGQQGTLTRLWARRGTRPRAPRDTRYRWACVFGAVCPARGTAAGLVLPFVNTAAMNAHLAETARNVAPGAHAILVLDGAGWHGARHLVVPDNLSLLTLPPCSPDLNPVENVRALPHAPTSSPSPSSTLATTASMPAARHGTSSQTTQRPSLRLPHATGQRSINRDVGRTRLESPTIAHNREGILTHGQDVRIPARNQPDPWDCPAVPPQSPGSGHGRREPG
jgi:hypothetical protein